MAIITLFPNVQAAGCAVTVPSPSRDQVSTKGWQPTSALCRGPSGCVGDTRQRRCGHANQHIPNLRLLCEEGSTELQKSACTESQQRDNESTMRVSFVSPEPQGCCMVIQTGHRLTIMLHNQRHLSPAMRPNSTRCMFCVKDEDMERECAAYLRARLSHSPCKLTQAGIQFSRHSTDDTHVQCLVDRDHQHHCVHGVQ